MTGEAETKECVIGEHETCPGKLEGYRNAIIACTCRCHVPKPTPKKVIHTRGPSSGSKRRRK